MIGDTFTDAALQDCHRSLNKSREATDLEEALRHTRSALFSLLQAFEHQRNMRRILNGD